MPLSSGTQLASYVILSPLGSGGMGEVYKARDPRLNRLVAIKVLPQDLQGDPSALARFEREARILAGLNHPHVVAIYDVGSEGGVSFVVTELLEGETLGALLTRGPVPTTRAMAIACQIALGLTAAHDKGIVHRDLKPSNVFIGRGDHAKLLDFGLAKDLRLELESSATDAMEIPGHTLKGTLLGTVGYMSPEQVRGEAVDPRSDIFSLGVLLLEMLTGRQAFTGDSAVEVLHAILREDPLEGCALPTELRLILERMLAKDPEQRFQTVRDLAFVLHAQKQNAAPAPSPQHSLLTRSRKAAIVGTLFLGIAGLGWRLWPSPLPPQSPLAWTQITVRPTLVTAARFSPDGQALAFTAEGPDGRMAIFSQAEGEAFPRATGQSGKVLALDRGGETFFCGMGQLAFNPGAGLSGSLYRWKGEGTSPRVWIEGIQDADLAPKSRRLAVIKYQEGISTGSAFGATLESPPGRVLARSKVWMGCSRWSPDEKSIAFIEHGGNDWQGQIVIVDLNGHEKFRSQMLDAVCSLAWTPDGGEIAFTTDHGYRRPMVIAAMDWKGRTRELLSAGESLFLMDIDARGRMLLSTHTQTFRHQWEAGNGFSELDLPFRADFASVLSPDGSKAAFTAVEADLNTWIYARDLKTKQLTRLTSGGRPLAFSPDNTWLLVEKSPARERSDHQVSLVPFGSGTEIPLNVQGIKGCWSGALPDPDHPIVMAEGPGGSPDAYLLDPKLPPKSLAQGLDHPIFWPIVAAESGSLWAFDLKNGMVRSSLRGEPWKPLGGLLADRVPLAANPRTGEILVAQRKQFVDPYFLSQPYGPVVLEVMDPKTLRIRPNRTLQLPHGGLLLSTLHVVSEGALTGRTEYRGHLFVVEGLLGSRSR